ncbi:MAG: hypothetical protein AB1523_09890 [Bacillota bacterium]
MIQPADGLDGPDGGGAVADDHVVHKEILLSMSRGLGCKTILIFYSVRYNRQKVLLNPGKGLKKD